MQRIISHFNGFVSNIQLKLCDFLLNSIFLFSHKHTHTHIDYLEELNTTGAFPDETDKTPMVNIFRI